MTEVLKEGWKKVAFGDVVRLCRERTSNPEADGFSCYVGLEHLDPEDLKIRRRGNVKDGTTFTNIFRSGQVLFGKRRAYQRKVALADFEGVCSGDIYVFETKNESLLNDLLPFICQTEKFFEHAIGTSAGSLSPRTNWESISRYEFPLPPLEEQKEYVKALSAMENCIGKKEVLVNDTKKLKKSLTKELFSNGIGHSVFKQTESIEKIPITWDSKKIGELFFVKTGTTPSTSQLGYWAQGDVIWITPLDLSAINGTKDIADSERKITRNAVEECNLNILPIGSIILSTRAPVGYIAINQVEACFNQGCKGLVPQLQENVSTDFYYYYLSSIKTLLERMSGGSTFQELSKASLEAIVIPIPPLSEQQQIASILNKVDAVITTAKKDITATKLIKMKLINQIFTNGDTITIQSGDN